MERQSAHLSSRRAMTSGDPRASAVSAGASRPDGRCGDASEVADRLIRPLLAKLPDVQRRPFVLGLCGAQGSGKSTAAELVRAQLTAQGISTATLSIDDLYLPGEARAALARNVHPLLRTRGVPGTHDLAPAWEIISLASRPGPIKLPRFDKAQDEPVDESSVDIFRGPMQVLILEGWCVGAASEPSQNLIEPMNELERIEDADGRWRAWVNTQLGGAYQALFARLDMLALLAAPSTGIIATWRREQEQHLRRSLAEQNRRADKTMSDADVGRFVQFFERITTHVLTEMPRRADVVIRLDEHRRIVSE